MTIPYHIQVVACLELLGALIAGPGGYAMVKLYRERRDVEAQEKKGFFGV